MRKEKESGLLNLYNFFYGKDYYFFNLYLSILFIKITKNKKQNNTF